MRAGHMMIAPVPRAVKPTRCVSDQWERHHCCRTGSTAHWLLYTVRFHVTLSYVGSAGSKIATDADVACCHVRTPWRGCRSSARQSPREETAAAVTCGDDGRQAGAGRHAVRHYSGRACLCGRPRLIAGRGRLGGRGVCGGCDRRSPQGRCAGDHPAVMAVTVSRVSVPSIAGEVGVLCERRVWAFLCGSEGEAAGADSDASHVSPLSSDFRRGALQTRAFTCLQVFYGASVCCSLPYLRHPFLWIPQVACEEKQPAAWCLASTADDPGSVPR